jgi:hypothetical protein
MAKEPDRQSCLNQYTNYSVVGSQITCPLVAFQLSPCDAALGLSTYLGLSVCTYIH